ncbi:hypothetical protein [Streptomyces specialis]|uniref:hypothetical protein n=1 Tax=Streptomyces specialis TaxID=498367 RepID=UPI00073F5865|nr:hypothetical protein [Streptomyces specialis]
MLHNGAELVTTAPWTLPTNLAFHRYGGVAATERPPAGAVVAVDAAHDGEDPVAALCGRQRDRLADWRNGRGVAHSPPLRAAVATVGA